jgi:Putative auto-transporter adhesin, head GIN domain
MKKYTYIVAIIFLATACNNNGRRGSGNIITEARNVSAFTKVSAATSIDVDVQQGAETSVIVEADDNLIKYIETTVVGGELKIRLKNISIWNEATIKVHVIAPKYDGFSASSSAKIIGKNTITSTSKIKLDASSSAKIDLEIDAPSVDVEASSSADIIAAGRTKEVTVDANSSSTVELDKLQAEIVNAEASSSAGVSIFASVKIAKANSSGDISYTGGATDVNKSESSSGTVTKK